MKTDSIFYRLFQTFPGIFFELIDQPLSEANIYEFMSVEIKQTAFRIDGLFLPAPGSCSQHIYFVEVQFQPDPNLYSRFFAEIFLYLRHNYPQNDWRAVVVYANRSVDAGNIENYRELFESQRVSRVYLEELAEAAQSIGIQTVKLVVEAEEKATERARNLIDKARQEIADEVSKRELIQLIETILVYKFPQKSREEIEKMLGLTELKQTRVYQEALEEGERKAKLEAAPRFLALGLSVEQVAEALALDAEEVRQAAQQQPS